MLKGLKWTAFSLLGLVLLALVVVLVSWAIPPTADEHAALAAMRATPPALAAEQNAFPAVWLLAYDGIDAQHQRVLTAQDVERYTQTVAGGSGQVYAGSVAKGRFPEVTPAKDWCGRKAGSCLQQVRADPEQVAAAHAGHAGLHQRLAGLSHFDAYRDPFPVDLAIPIPALAPLFDRVSLHALAHVRGDSTTALQGICEDVRSARLLMGHSDSLLLAMVGGALAERSAALFSEILAELPAGTTLPADCSAAFVPPRVDEMDLCHAMRGEFGYLRAAVETTPVAPWQEWLYDKEKTLARGASLYARNCTAQVRAQIRDDRPVVLAAGPSNVSLRCVANAVGCILLDVAEPTYAAYPLRLQDAGAQLRLAATMLWLHGQPSAGADLMQTLQRLPAGLGSDGRPWQRSADGRQLQVHRHARPGEGVPAMITAPVPAAWQPH